MKDIVIIGAGISGLYMAYKLSLKYSNSNIILLEKNKRIGGRIFTYKDDFFQVEAGAGRFHSKQKHLITLLRHLDLFKTRIPISTDYKIVNSCSPGILQTSEINQILTELFSKPRNSKKSLQSMTFYQFISSKLGKCKADYVSDFFGYSSEITSMNAFDSIKMIEQYFMGRIDYFVLKDGLSSIIHSLIKLLPNNVKIITDKSMTDIKHLEDGTFEVFCSNRKTPYICDICICATTFNSIEKLPLFNCLKPYFKFMENKPMSRIYSKFDDSWFKDLPKLTFDNDLRYMIPVSKNVLMMSYTDDIYATKWNNLKNKKGIRGVINKHRELYSDSLGFKIPLPTHSKMFFWEHGVMIHKPGFDSTTMPSKMLQPYKDKLLFLCGENYSAYNVAWIEGALETCDEVLTLL